MPSLSLVFALWAGICTAVMLPLSSRATLVFARMLQRRALDWRGLRTLLFVLGHVLVCAAFAGSLALLHWSLHRAGLLDDALALDHPAAVGLALVVAGVYQWLPAKHACLEHCRAPMPGLLAGWRDGFLGALDRGMLHARLCLGCFGLLMLLPLAAGPANPVALAAILLLAPVELRADSGHWIACAGGLALLAWGTRLLFP